jgi:protein-S-isoprenylcysteine O-methyltransferase Ste14
MTAVRAGLYGSCFVALWIWLAVLVRPYDAALGGRLPAWLQPVGVALVVVGGPLALACWVLFVVAGRGTPVPFDAPRVFVAIGPYRWLRNPMYAGGLALLAGAGLWLRSPSIAALSAIAWGVAHAFVLLYEEPALTRRFGSTYLEYKGTVNRWIPRPPAGRPEP